MWILADPDKMGVSIHHDGQFVETVVQTQRQSEMSRERGCMDTTGEGGTGRPEVTGDRAINVVQGSKDRNGAI